MTISTQQSSQTFLGNGATNSFNFTFVGDAASDIIVSYTDADGNVTVLTPAQYTLFLNPASTGSLWGVGGTVTYPIMGSPIANGTSITISRILPLTQETSISNQGAFTPSVIETALDTLEMQLQQVAARTGLFRGIWATGLLYNFGDIVVDGANGTDTGNYYSCAFANVSGTWSTDLSAGDWILAINVQSLNVSVATAVAAAATATTQAGIATTQASNAASSAGSASTSATSASTSATSAAASAVTAASFGSTLKGTSTTSNTIAIGSKSFTTQSGLTFVAGGFVVAVDQGNSANYMHGQITSYSGTSLIINVTDIGGSGTISAWNIILSGTQGSSGVILVTQFGAIGDGITDDTDAFVAARNAWEAVIRTNPAPGANSNKLGTYPYIGIPPGSYLITSPQAFLDSGFTTRTVGMGWTGTGTSGECQILYQPSTVGPLVYNNDAVLDLRFDNISFNANSSTNADFMYSTSAGGAQDVGFNNCSWSGTWRYGIQLQGTNNNSEFYWNNCAIYGTWTNYLYSVASDQFLNYWFNESKIWSFTGTFVKMVKGGHVKIVGADFSDFNPSTSSVLYSLEGTNHSQGVCFFSEENCRYEIKSSNAKIMYCEWPQGIVNVIGADESSQSSTSGSSAWITREFSTAETNGPIVSMKNSLFMGIHKYRAGNSSWPYKKELVYENCKTLHYADLYSMVDTDLTTGTNYNGIWSPLFINCKGADSNAFTTYTAWAASTSISLDDVRIAGSYVYKCTTAGTTGTNRPWGAGSVVDGTVTWAKQDLFYASDWVTNGRLGQEKIRNTDGTKRIAVIGRSISGGSGWIARVSATAPNNVRVILPPNSIIMGIYLNVPAGASVQASAGTIKVFTDEASPTTFLNYTTPGNMSAGFATSYTTPFNCGTAIGTRSIIFQAFTDVINSVSYPGLAWIEYHSGE